jgi:hypothetical protein
MCFQLVLLKYRTKIKYLCRCLMDSIINDVASGVDGRGMFKAAVLIYLRIGLFNDAVSSSDYSPQCLVVRMGNE